LNPGEVNLKPPPMGEKKPPKKFPKGKLGTTPTPFPTLRGKIGAPTKKKGGNHKRSQ